MRRWLAPEQGTEIDDDELKCLRYDKVHKKLDEPKTLEQIKELANSRTAGIWRIKRAKIILNTLEGKSVHRMVRDIRVPPESIMKCQQEFGEKGIAYFDRPCRKPTQREFDVERMLVFLEQPPPLNSTSWDIRKVKYIGHCYSARQIMEIRELIGRRPDLSRAGIAAEICLKYGLYQNNGKLKKSQTAQALVRMQMDNMIVLPTPKRAPTKNYEPVPKTITPPPHKLVVKSCEMDRIEIIPVTASNELRLWREMVEHYHYIGTSKMFGAQLRYLVFGHGKSLETAVKTTCATKKHSTHGTCNGLFMDGRILLGVLGFASPAWRLASREKFIGWNEDQRLANMKLLVNNARFLILPWIRSANLASKILGGVARRLPDDWEERYGCRPVLLETFVRLDRFKGTCYRAANWIPIGETGGYSLYHCYKKNAIKKAVYLYPLDKDYRKILCTI